MCRFFSHGMLWGAWVPSILLIFRFGHGSWDNILISQFFLFCWALGVVVVLCGLYSHVFILAHFICTQVACMFCCCWIIITTYSLNLIFKMRLWQINIVKWWFDLGILWNTMKKIFGKPVVTIVIFIFFNELL